LTLKKIVFKGEAR